MEAKNILIAVAGILTVLSCLPYVIDIAKNKTHPNLVTWVTWMTVVGISTAAAISEHAYHTAILSGAIVLTDIVIVAMSIKKGVKKYTAFDIVCQALAVIGLILWRVTGNPSTAVALSLLVIVIAALPTWRHAWIKPHEETWEGFAIGAVAGALTILSLSSYSFVALALPIVTVVNCSIIALVITTRRQALIETKVAQ
ncbi:MAG TPA: hypothetical protein VMR28_02045 [Candidatus Saccharimonadales bacterium]|nr:hypothetical protein [Candidatus Saccharimonadales bacterium]